VVSALQCLVPGPKVINDSALNSELDFLWPQWVIENGYGSTSNSISDGEIFEEASGTKSR
jgi:hypothetical protein